MSAHGGDPVDDTTPVFTQGDVFVIGGYLAEVWGVGADRDVVDDVEWAVRAALQPREAA